MGNGRLAFERLAQHRKQQGTCADLYAQHRRREDSGASQSIMGQRFGRHITSFVNLLHGVAKTFGNASQVVLRKCYKDILLEGDFIYHEHRLANILAELRSPNGKVSFFPRSGAPQGSREGPVGFVHVFRSVLHDWTLEMQDRSRHMTVVCAIFWFASRRVGEQVPRGHLPQDLGGLAVCGSV